MASVVEEAAADGAGDADDQLVVKAEDDVVQDGVGGVSRDEGAADLNWSIGWQNKWVANEPELVFFSCGVDW